LASTRNRQIIKSISLRMISLVSATAAFQAPAASVRHVAAQHSAVSMMAKSKALPFLESPAVRQLAAVAPCHMNLSECGRPMRAPLLSEHHESRSSVVCAAPRGNDRQCWLRPDGAFHTSEHQVDARGRAQARPHVPARVVCESLPDILLSRHNSVDCCLPLHISLKSTPCSFHIHPPGNSPSIRSSQGYVAVDLGIKFPGARYDLTSFAAHDALAKKELFFALLLVGTFETIGFTQASDIMLRARLSCCGSHF